VQAVADKKRSPLHVQIRNDIISKIDSGEWAPGTKLDKELDLAASYGVSRITIRQALSDSARSGYIERVKRRGSVVTDKKPPMPDNGWIAMITYDPFNYLVQETLAGAESALAPCGLGLRMYTTNNSPERTEKVVEQSVEEGAKGLFVFMPEDTTYSPAIHSLKRKGFPVCLFDRPLKQLTTDCVMTDHVEGGFIATSHLIDRCHRRIGFVSGVDLSRTYPAGARYEGYRSAMELANLPIDKNFVITGQSADMTWVTILQEALLQPTRPTALFAVNDIVAAIILQTASSLGLRVPDDLAIVGFDNTDVVSKFHVPLTTVEQPFKEIGSTAISLLLERIGGRASISWVILPPKLVIRTSSGNS
jgi:DNA-binding LacI/PurR family transcriptional regulator